MKKPDATKIIAAYALFMCASTVFAHERHGMTGAHWHATDIWGFLATGGALTLMVWFTRGGK